MSPYIIAACVFVTVVFHCDTMACSCNVEFCTEMCRVSQAHCGCCFEFVCPYAATACPFRVWHRIRLQCRGDTVTSAVSRSTASRSPSQRSTDSRSSDIIWDKLTELLSLPFAVPDVYRPLRLVFTVWSENADSSYGEFMDYLCEGLISLMSQRVSSAPSSVVV